VTIHIAVGDQILTAELDDTPAASAFAAMLPLNVTLTDFHGTEKVADLPDLIPVQDASAGYKPPLGDLTYYAPWRNLAISYCDFDYSTGLVRLGYVTSDLTALGALEGKAIISEAEPAP
jgi:hypothetical protein